MPGMLFPYAPGIYPLMAQASFSPAKAEFEKVRMAKTGPATASHKPTIGAISTSGTGDAMAGSEGCAGVVLFPKEEQLTRLLDTPFANLIPPQQVSEFPLQSSLNQSIPPSGPSTHLALADSLSLCIPTQTEQWPSVGQRLSLSPNLISSPLVKSLPVLDLSRNHSTIITSSITQEQIAQSSAGLPEIASNAGTLATDLIGIQVAI